MCEIQAPVERAGRGWLHQAVGHAAAGCSAELEIKAAHFALHYAWLRRTAGGQEQGRKKEGVSDHWSERVTRKNVGLSSSPAGIRVSRRASERFAVGCSAPRITTISRRRGPLVAHASLVRPAVWNVGGMHMLC